MSEFLVMRVDSTDRRLMALECGVMIHKKPRTLYAAAENLTKATKSIQFSEW